MFKWDSEDDREKLLEAILVILRELRGDDASKETIEVPVADPDVDAEMFDHGDYEGSMFDADFEERSKFIPLRLSPRERKVQRLVDNCLKVSEYTDRVDQISNKRVHTVMKNSYALMSGVIAGISFKTGRELVNSRDFAAQKELIAAAFEISRRYHLGNPELLRGNYAKLVHMLQDTMLPEVREQLNFSCVSELVTVHHFLKQRNILAIVRDPLAANATKEIIPGRKSRPEINAEIREKERAVERLARKYGGGSEAVEDEIRLALYSLGDNNAFLRASRDPCDEMIAYLTKYFSDEEPLRVSDSLAIMSGRGGARLTHDHRRQYEYVLQTLWLWREVLHDLCKLMIIAERDLLNPNEPYVLRNTGQGIHRLQRAPRLKREMELVVKRVRKRVPNWVGSDVVHLGDHNVPNALMFIEKYAHVPRILLPLTTALRQMDKIEDQTILKYVEDAFGSVEDAKKEVLRDFYRHAFDGSGADNFFDAGSCIDGRLTSAWHWCNELEKKSFYHLFKLIGFVSFDSNLH
uniref:Non-canonical E2 ubiquitin-conjugating enzyme C-terminal domain-containing protein n=1 Tax=Rhodosorus marinus TaxID=101924 RepID=A0A7S3EEL5_9RHOD|mmetsp:Transcript_27505/g.107711  ORF Transcript_27505/g.107711 Transcript_27505/m.107711 type:complete len:521 (+) Transcript_27505:987-2549(+)